MKVWVFQRDLTFKGGTWGCRTPHLEYVAGYTNPLLFLFEQTQQLMVLTTRGKPWWLRVWANPEFVQLHRWGPWVLERFLGYWGPQNCEILHLPRPIKAKQHFFFLKKKKKTRRKGLPDSFWIITTPRLGLPCPGYFDVFASRGACLSRLYSRLKWRGLTTFAGATKRAFSAIWYMSFCLGICNWSKILWNPDYRQRLPLKSTDVWRCRIQPLCVLRR